MRMVALATQVRLMSFNWGKAEAVRDKSSAGPFFPDGATS
jgi:hypothetical protein